MAKRQENPVDFSKYFWLEMGCGLAGIISLSRGQLLLSCCTADLTLFWKKCFGRVNYPDQTYCVLGRLIHDTTSVIRDVLEIGKFLHLDFWHVLDESFDRVEHNYL